MRALWWRLPGTLALCSWTAPRTLSPLRRWTTRPPTRCWPCWTSTQTANACPSSVSTLHIYTPISDGTHRHATIWGYTTRIHLRVHKDTHPSEVTHDTHPSEVTLPSEVTHGHTSIWGYIRTHIHLRLHTDTHPSEVTPTHIHLRLHHDTHPSEVTHRHIHLRLHTNTHPSEGTHRHTSIWGYTPTHIHLRLHTDTHPSEVTQICIHLRLHTDTHPSEGTNPSEGTHGHTSIWGYTPTHIHLRIHTTHIHLRVHTDTHPSEGTLPSEVTHGHAFWGYTQTQIWVACLKIILKPRVSMSSMPFRILQCLCLSSEVPRRPYPSVL